MTFDAVPPNPFALRVLLGKGVIAVTVLLPLLPPPLASADDEREGLTGDIGPGAGSLLQPMARSSKLTTAQAKML
jgi:hypothetical protein